MVGFQNIKFYEVLEFWKYIFFFIPYDFSQKWCQTWKSKKAKTTK